LINLDVSRIRALGPVGEDVILLRGEHFSETYSITALISLHPSKYLYATGMLFDCD
jgi:hypothetical protein